MSHCSCIHDVAQRILLYFTRGYDWMNDSMVDPARLLIRSLNELIYQFLGMWYLTVNMVIMSQETMYFSWIFLLTDVITEVSHDHGYKHLSNETCSPNSFSSLHHMTFSVIWRTRKLMKASESVKMFWRNTYSSLRRNYHGKHLYNVCLCS